MSEREKEKRIFFFYFLILCYIEISTDCQTNRIVKDLSLIYDKGRRRLMSNVPIPSNETKDLQSADCLMLLFKNKYFVYIIRISGGREGRPTDHR